MTDKLSPEPLALGPAKRPFWTRISLVWLVPVLALIVSLGVAWRTFEDRGTLIEVVFPDASGLEVGKTVLKFREVDVGKVEKIGFNADLSQVVVSIRVDKDVAPFVDADSSFWLVRPELTTSGISRLDTVLSGVFIEGLWDATPGVLTTRFAALKDAPLARTPGEGTWITLFSEDGGSLAEGAPVIYRGIKVGQLRNLRLNEASAGVQVDAFIKSPYDERLTSTSVFWDTSGFSVSFGSEGLKLNVRSVASLIQGGVEFSTLVSGGKPVEASHQYRLFSDEASARSSVFNDAVSAPVNLALLLDGSIRNIAVGTAVTYRGLPVGEVEGLHVRADQTPGGVQVYRQEVDFKINGEKMGLPDGVTPKEVMDFMKTQVEQGLRARLVSTGLFGGKLEIELTVLPDAKPDKILFADGEIPVMPNIEPKVADFSQVTGDILNRVQKLPVEDLMQSAIRVLDSANLFIAKDGTQKAPEQLTALLGDLRGFVGSEDVQAVPGALRGGLDNAQSILGDLKKADVAGQLTTTVDTLKTAASAFTEATKGVPALVDQAKAFAAKLNELPMQDLAASSKSTVEAIGSFMRADGMQQVPASLGAALTSFGQTLDDLRKGGAVTNLNAALESARHAAETVAKSTDQLPEVIDQLKAAAANVNRLAAGYGANSDVGKLVQTMLREIQRTAAAVGSTAKTIERNPQSFLFGR